MERETWSIEITLADTETGVTAVARLLDAPETGIGIGSARHDGSQLDLSRRRALAVRGSLEDLTGSLDYLGDVRTLSAADQA